MSVRFHLLHNCQQLCMKSMKDLDCNTYFQYYQLSFHSPQVKWYLIFSTTNIVYELPHELPNDLWLGSKEIRKYQEKIKIGWGIGLSEQSSFLKQEFHNSSQKLLLSKLSKFSISVQFCLISLFKYYILDRSFFLEKDFSRCPSRLHFASYFIPNLRK